VPRRRGGLVSRLSSIQRAQLACLELLPPKLRRVGRGHLLDENRGSAAQVHLSDLADPAGLMGVMLRRKGGVPSKVRGLRELFCSLTKSYDAALSAATTLQQGPSSSGGGALGLGR
jgi:hypothetical protein